MNEAAKKKSILSIDGGGIRGIIPASTLVALEQQLGKPVRDCFDFVAGTSTGALIAAAVAAGVPATQILNIYKQR
jgi:patatin-like phospholipase/acyl hydrolase